MNNEHLKTSLSMFIFGSLLVQYGTKLVVVGTKIDKNKENPMKPYPTFNIQN
jgi:hypothetical protein